MPATTRGRRLEDAALQQLRRGLQRDTGLLSQRARCVSLVRSLGEAVQLAAAPPGARSCAGRGEVPRGRIDSGL
eukprot:535843-Alexandrium_andersonii.AAC.1